MGRESSVKANGKISSDLGGLRAVLRYRQLPYAGCRSTTSENTACSLTLIIDARYRHFNVWVRVIDDIVHRAV